MFSKSIAFCLAITISVALAKPELDLSPFLTDDYINHINSVQSTWKAGRNFPLNFTMKQVKSMTGALIPESFESNLLPKLEFTDEISDSEIPEEFDARKKWPECKSIRQVRDQGSCGSCWAEGATEAMSDRICIASKGKIQVEISVEDLLSCCQECGYGCHGGNPPAAWQYWVEEGLVTGGEYGTNNSCRPYTIKDCAHHVQSKKRQPCHGIDHTPACKKQCNSNYGKSFESDKYYGEKAYYIERDVKKIQKEIMTNGPVEAVFIVYTDFLNYKSGVYQRTSGQMVSGHAVKMIGWGVENGTPYWLIVNS